MKHQKEHKTYFNTKRGKKEDEEQHQQEEEEEHPSSLVRQPEGGNRRRHTTFIHPDAATTITITITSLHHQHYCH